MAQSIEEQYLDGIPVPAASPSAPHRRRHPTMADHDGHTINVGPVSVSIDVGPVSVSIDVDALRGDCVHASPAMLGTRVLALCDEVDRLRVERDALAAALEDIARMFEAQSMDGLWIAGAECSSHGVVCYMENPDDPDEWCPVCVAEVAWCAWKMGTLGA